MTMLRVVLLALLVVNAAPSRAHLVPLDPSTCALDVALSSPLGGTSATVDPPAAGDLIRATYEADSSIVRSRMQLCPADPGDPAGRCGPVVARGLAVGATPGTIAVPAAFALRLFASGDLTADAVPITIVLDGSPFVVPFALSTGYVAGGAPHFGTPLDTTGAFHLIGIGELPEAAGLFGSSALRLDLGCTLAPPPDLDQFALGPRLRKVRGKLTAEKAKVTMLLESEVPLPGDFATAPTVIRLGAEGAALLDTVQATVAGPRGRFVSADGTLTVVPLRRRIGLAYRIVYRGAATPPTPFASGGSAVAVSAGGLVARHGIALRATRRGTRLALREQ